MRRWICAVVLLLAAAPAGFADDDDRRGRGRGRGRGWGHYKHHRRPPVVYVERWAPAYAPVPVYYRQRMRPVPVAYYDDYGPVPRGCRRAYMDGYVVDYRPSNFLVVNFFKAW